MAARHLPTYRRLFCTELLLTFCHVVFRRLELLSQVHAAFCCWSEPFLARTAATPHHHTHLRLHLLHLLHHGKPPMLLQWMRLQAMNRPVSFHNLRVEKINRLSLAISA